jgi:predicted MarR family transcription regulator
MQDKNREKTERLEKEVDARGVEVEIGMRERLDFHCWYTGSDDYVMHTYASSLALAVSELARIRNRKKVTVHVTRHGFRVSAKPIKLRNGKFVTKCEENHANRSHD